MFKRVVVGIDGSPASLIAVKHAFEIARHFNTPVVGIFVIDERLLDESFLLELSSILGFTFYPGISARVKEFLEEQGDLLLKTFAEEGRKSGVKISIVQVQGIPWKEIINEADEEDLIVIGKKGKKLIKGVLVSSNAENIVRNAPCPVFMLADSDREFKKVCVAYDGRENSKKALEIANALKDVYNYEMNVVSAVENLEEAKEREKEVKTVLKEGFRFYGIKGIPEEVLVDFCKRNSIDILFMGAYGKGPVREFFLGSVTTYIIHNLDIPLLLIRKPHDKG
ncbi:MAG TPA: universal stress protein [Aquifex aeolicus]|nr:universal stress protein [Aquifex aeolicus]